MSLSEAISQFTPAIRSSIRPQALYFVMPGLVPGIHVLLLAHVKDVDGRVKPGHDGAP
jgi:hypothetical protein